MRGRPPRAPRRFDRFPAQASAELDGMPQEVAERAAAALGGPRWWRRFRVDVRDEGRGVWSVAAERGYLRETGNLVFHLALVGLLVFGLVPDDLLWLALVGAVLWGMGAALGFPVGMSAASDDPLRAAARVSVVSTIGYSAFLAGPPLLGLLAHEVGYRHALLAIAVPIVVGLLVVNAAAPARQEPAERPTLVP